MSEHCQRTMSCTGQSTSGAAPAGVLPVKARSLAAMRAFLVALAIGSPVVAEAKCDSVAYSVSGTVLTSTATTVARATVKAQWLQYGKPVELSTRSDANGRYSFTIVFDPVSTPRPGSVDLYGCAAKLVTISVEATGPGNEKGSVQLDNPAPTTNANVTLTKRNGG